jgi:hypothetical protein
MTISQEMGYFESRHIEAESTLCGLQLHEKISVESLRMDSGNIKKIPKKEPFLIGSVSNCT